MWLMKKMRNILKRTQAAQMMTIVNIEYHWPRKTVNYFSL